MVNERTEAAETVCNLMIEGRWQTAYEHALKWLALVNGEDE